MKNLTKKQSTKTEIEKGMSFPVKRWCVSLMTIIARCKDDEFDTKSAMFYDEKEARDKMEAIVKDLSMNAAFKNMSVIRNDHKSGNQTGIRVLEGDNIVESYVVFIVDQSDETEEERQKALESLLEY